MPFFYDLVDCLGASNRAQGSPTVGADIYAVFRTEGIGLDTRDHGVAIMFGDQEQLRSRSERFISRVAPDKPQRFFEAPNGRQILNHKSKISQYELYAIDRAWQTINPPDWVTEDNKNLEHGIVISFLGRDHLNRLATKFQDNLSHYFDTNIQRLEAEIDRQKQLRSELEEEISKTKRLETERRWREEENARYKKKAVWKKISRELNHTFGNALNTIEESSRILHELSIDLDRRLESEFGRKIKRTDYSAPDMRNVPTLASSQSPFEDYLDSFGENLFWVTSKFFRGTSRARPIVNEFKEYATSNAGVRLEKSTVSELMNVIQDALIHEGVTSVPGTDNDWNRVYLEMDGEKLHQVFTELIQNAKSIFEAYELKGQVRIRVKVERLSHGSRRGSSYESILNEGKDGYILVTVADNGPGVPYDDKNEIFTPFVTIRPENTPKGSGQGLDICDQIIQGHEGRIIEDGTPGKGAKFRIFLPITNEN